MNDYELLKYYYEELIMSLITMSLPAEKQKEMVGIGCIGDEILEDFYNFYSMRRQVYIDDGFLMKNSCKYLMNLINI